MTVVRLDLQPWVLGLTVERLHLLLQDLSVLLDLIVINTFHLREEERVHARRQVARLLAQIFVYDLLSHLLYLFLIALLLACLLAQMS